MRPEGGGYNRHARVAAAARIVRMSSTGAVFLFPGLGTEVPDAGRTLYGQDEVFRDCFDLIAGRVRAAGGPEIGPPAPADAASLRVPARAQLELLALELSLVAALARRGVRPVALLGHSLGEWTAGVVAGLLGLDEAIAGLLMVSAGVEAAPSSGGMALVFEPAAAVEARLAGLEGVWLAARNGPAYVAVAGRTEALAALRRSAEAEGRRVQPLATPFAFHCPLAAPIADRLRAGLAGLPARTPRVPVASGLEAAVLEGPLDADRWARQLAAPVDFAGAVLALRARGHRRFVELGPGTALTAMIQELDAGLEALPALRRFQDEGAQLDALVETLARSAPVVAAPAVEAPPTAAPTEPGPRVAARAEATAAEGPSPARVRALSALLRSRAARALDRAPETLAVDVPLRDQGVDSAALVSVAAALSERLGAPLPAVSLFEHGSLDRLARHLLARAAPAVAGSETARVEPEPGRAANASRGDARAEREGAIAIIGLAGRFPGAPSVDALWALLERGGHALRPPPPERVVGAPEPDAFVTAGYLDDVDRFDAAFFGISPREARRMDPQQRIFLEVAWQALEHAALAGPRVYGSRTGVFVGACAPEYPGRLSPDDHDPQRMTGAHQSIISNRLSYLLDLRGPSLTLDTSCSASLVAVAEAVASLRRGACDVAIAGGVYLALDSGLFAQLVQLGALAPDGRIKTFDRRADGYVRGEGAAAVVLKPLADAERDGDPIHAVIVGTALNHGGRSNGLTAPNPAAQREAHLAAWADAGVSPERLGLVEAHGSGTALGDPIEIRGLSEAIGRHTARRAFCAIGSLKTNIGHLEPAGGIAGLVKMVECVRRGVLVPSSVFFEHPNPAAELHRSPFHLVTRSRPWRSERPRLGSVSSWGVGGTNAVVLVEQAAPPTPAPAAPHPGARVAVVSARTEAALSARLRDLAAHLQAHSELALDDVCRSLAEGRAAFEHRVAIVARTLEQLIDRLDLAARGAPADPARGLFRGALERVAPLGAGPESPALRLRRRAPEASFVGTGLDPAALLAAEPEYAALWGDRPHPGPRPDAAALSHALDTLARLLAAWGLTASEDAEGEAIELWLAAEPEPGAGPGLTALPPRASEGLAPLRAAAFVRGLPVRLGSRGRFVALPAGPFDGRRHWPDEGGRAVHPVLPITLAALEAEPLPTDAEAGLAGLETRARAGAFALLQPELGRSVEAIAADWGVGPERRPQLERLIAAAERSGGLTRRGRRLCAAGPSSGPGPSPGFELEAELLDRALAGTREVLAGREDGAALLYGDGRVDALSVGALAHRRLRAAAVRSLGALGARRVLQLGAELAPLELPGVQRLCTAATPEGAEQAAARFGGVWVAWDPSRDPPPASLPAELDAIFVQEHLHLAPQVVASLVARLRPGGVLMAIETTGALDWVQLVFGLDPRWKDGELLRGPLLDTARWLDRLRAAGLRGVASFPGETGGALGVQLLVGHRPGGAAPIATPAHAPSSPTTSALAATTAPPPSPPAPAARPTPPRLSALITETIAGVLEAEPESLGPSTRFTELGVDSIVALRLARALGARLEPAPKPTAFFRHRSLGALIEALERDGAAPRGATAEPMAVAPPPRAIAPTAPVPAAPAPVAPSTPAAATPTPPSSVPPARGPVRVEVAAPSAPHPTDEDPIAIVGLSGRFPGAADPEALWQLLIDGRSAVREVPPERWRHEDWYDPRPEARGKTYSRWGGFLDDVDAFDPLAFGISPREAELIDPHQRLFLEASALALEHAGLAPRALRGRPVGVFAGAVPNPHYRARAGLDFDDGLFLGPGTYDAVIANRVSYVFDLRGPSLSLSTNCSSSLLAVHLAAQSLRSGECELALAGGVNALLTPETYVLISRMRAFSPDGRCAPFSAGANGYVPGEGVGVVVLERLSRARALGHTVHAVLRATVANQDGRSLGIGAPNAEAQEALILDALDRAGVPADSIGLLEAHGTGTALGDPIEIEAASRAFAARTDRRGFCAIGSVKSNLGHLEGAAGVTGLIKAVLALRHGELPPILHLDAVNPVLELTRSPFYLLDRRRPWPSAGPRRAAVSSFGMGGTNVHAILESADEPPPPPGERVQREALVLVSARSAEALPARTAAIAEAIERSPERFADLAHTLARGREHHAHRLAVVARDAAEAVERLRADDDPLRVGPRRASSRPRVVLHFPGWGAQYVGMGERLFATEPRFAEAFEQCDAILRPTLGRSIVDVVRRGSDEEIADPVMTPATTFAIGWALARTWQSLGVPCDGVMGHSGGEYLAAALAGVFSLEDALVLATERGRIYHEHALPGAMGWVVADPARVKADLAAFDQVWIAAVNGPRLVTISGVEGQVEAALAAWSAAGLDAQRHIHSATRIAGHCPLMAPVQAPFAALLDGVRWGPSDRPFFSAMHERCYHGDAPDRAYWLDHIVEPVLYASALERARDHFRARRASTIFLECGPSRTVSAIARRTLGGDPEVTILSSLDHALEDESAFALAAAGLHAAGVELDWDAWFAGCGRRLVPAPIAPLSRRRFMLADARASTRAAASSPPTPEALGARLHHRVVRHEIEPAPPGAGPAGRWWSLASAALSGAALAPSAERVDETEPAGDWAELERRLAALRPDGVLVELGRLRAPLDSVSGLARAIARGTADVRLVLVGRGTLGEEPEHAAAAALARSAAKESPRLSLRLVDLDAETPLAVLGAELSDPTAPLEVVYRVGRRGVRRLEPCAPGPVLELVPRDGLVLITGGHGGVGGALAEHLVQAGARRLALLGRRPESELDAEARARLAALRSKAEVAHVAVALEDAAALEARLGELRRRHGRIAAVFHAAGHLEDALLHHQSREAFDRVLSPKIAGTAHLDALTAEDGPDLFVGFSSLAALYGNAAQAAYAAANAHLDASLLRRAARRPGLSLSIDWGMWAGLGMAARLSPELHARHRALGFTTHSAEEGFAALAHAPAGRVTVLSGVVGPALELAPRATPSPTASLPGGRAARDEAALVSGLTALFAELLHLGPEELEPDTPFGALGVDSLVLAQAQVGIERLGGGAVNPAAFLDHPSIAELARFLAERADAVVASAAAEPKPEAEPEPSAEPAPAPAHAAAAEASPRAIEPISNDATTPAPHAVPLAIVEAACRLPGADDPEALWAALLENRVAIGPPPAGRFDVRRWLAEGPGQRGRTPSLAAGWLPDVAGFDPAYFGWTDEEARSTDPQQRLLLEVVTELAQRAGIERRLRGSRTGVFVGARAGSYRVDEPTSWGRRTIVGGAGNFIAARLADRYDLRGPVLTVDTACSSSLVALHLAARAIAAGDCEAAIVAGTEIKARADVLVAMSQARASSPTGRSQPFGREADGFVPGEGVVALWLRPLEAARRDGDRVLAVVLGTAVNNDGHTMGITTPNPAQQRAVVRAALDAAGAGADRVGYLEAHGTGTLIGDPMELKALTQVFGEDTEDRRFCALGAVKANLGHLDTAAGALGLLKLALARSAGVQPPSPSAHDPNPRFDFEASPFVLLDRPRPWPSARPLAGVSAFGFGGTNAHAILGPPPEPRLVAPRPRLFVVGARTTDAHERLSAAVADRLEALATPTELAGAARGLAGRGPQPELRAVVADTGPEAAAQLRRGTAGPAVSRPRGPARLAFLFPGQGAQVPGAARRLYDEAPEFRAAFDACARGLSVDLHRLVFESEAETLARTRHTQPVIFAVGYALARQWQAWGVQPSAVIGHSIGELTAACVVGALSLEAALPLVEARAAAMDACLPGAMLALAADEDAALALIAALDPSLRADLALAAVNAPGRVVLAGPSASIEAAELRAAALGLRPRRLRVSHAFHSPSMRAAAERLRAHRIDPPPGTPSTPVVSNRDGRVLERFDAEHWAAHVLEPVRFADGILALATEHRIGVFLECGPGATLLGLAQLTLAAREGRRPQFVRSLREGRDDARAIREAAAALLEAGVPLDPSGLESEGPSLPLPTHPFDRRPLWIAQEPAPTEPEPIADLVVDGEGQQRRVRFRLSAPELADHRVRGEAVVPGAAHWELVRRLAGEALGRPIHGLRRVLHRARLPWSPVARLELRLDGLRFELHSDEALHAEGELRLEAEMSAPLPPLEGETRRLEPAEAYRRIAASGVELGPRFRPLRAARYAGRLGETELARPVGVDGWAFPPPMLDAALQSASGLIDERDTFIPLVVDAIDFLAPELGDEVRVRVQRRDADSTETISLDADLSSPDGAPRVRIRGVGLKRLRPAAAPGAPARESGALRAPTWSAGRTRTPPPAGADRPSPVPGPVASPVTIGRPAWATLGPREAAPPVERWLVLGRDPGLDGAAEALAAALAAVGGARIERAALDALPELEATLRSGPANGLLLWLGNAGADDAAGRARASRDAVLAVSPTLRMLAGLPPESLARVAVVGAPEAAQPIGAMLRCLSLERGPSVVVVERGPGANPRRLAEAVGLVASGALRVEHDHILVERDGEAEPAPLAWEEGAHILVTGGLGGIGRPLLLALAERAAPKLSLLVRQPVPPRREWSRPGAPPALETLWRLESHGAELELIPCDVADPDVVAAAVARARARFGPVRSVLHLAGVHHDALLARLEPERLARVFDTKLAAAVALDAATRQDPLDRFVVFSSLSARLGNVGQAAYAAANAALERFAETRDGPGRSQALAWTLWSVGMGEDPALVERLSRHGVRVLDARAGVAAFFDACDRAGRRLAIGAGPALGDTTSSSPPTASPRATTTPLAGSEDLRTWLGRRAAEELGLDGPPSKDTPFLELGLESATLVELAAELEERGGVRLYPTLFFEHQTIEALARHLESAHGAAFTAPPTARPTAPPRALDPPSPAALGVVEPPAPAPHRIAAPAVHARPATPTGAIAILGMAGRVPGADDLDTFWRHTRDGVDALGPAPVDRFGDTDRPSGGFLEDLARFDAGLFGIPPREALVMDPQQRLFLEVAYAALEDAARAGPELRGSRTGVYVGVAHNLYRQDLPEITPYSALANENAVLANRLSYWLDLRGPSLSIDTLCSSALVATELAVRALRGGDTELAIAGGVFAGLNPAYYASVRAAGAMSPTARCRVFDAGADGYMPGEGAVAFVLAPLERALDRGDRIRAVIHGVAVNHGGRASRMTSPRRSAQVEVVEAALADAGLGPERIGFVEAHGTGTRLGDPIELDALSAAWSRHGVRPASCAISAVKSQIGHLEPAAGAASLARVVLALEHRCLPPTLHLRRPNPHVDLVGSPFYVVDRARPWPDSAPPLAAASAFGMGGVNAHVVVGPAPERPRGVDPRPGAEPIVLSAADPDALLRAAERLLNAVRDSDVPIADVALTLALGRARHRYRLAFVAGDRAELVARLEAAVAGAVEDRGEVDETPARLRPLATLVEDPGWARRARAALEHAPVAAEDEDLIQAADAGPVELCRALARRVEAWGLCRSDGAGPALVLGPAPPGPGWSLDPAEGRRAWAALLARALRCGLEPDLGPWFEGRGLRRVGLPSYAFGGERFWAPPRPGPTTDPRPAASDEPHPAGARETVTTATPPAPAPETATSDPAIVEPDRLEAGIRARLIGLLAEAMGRPEAELARADFSELGLDSVVAVDVARALETLSGAEIPSTMLFDFRGPADAAAYLARTRGEAFARALALAPPAPPAPAGTSHDADAARTEMAPPPTPAATEPAPAPRPAPITASPAPETSSQGSMPIAVIGLAGRFPGADDTEQLWRNLRAGVCSITEVPRSRWDVDRCFDPAGGPGKTFSRWGGFLSEIDRFDPAFFGLSPREARAMDPQQRLVLETAWRSFESAGLGDRVRGTRTGVFVGVSYNTFQQDHLRELVDGASLGLATSNAMLAHRVSFTFDLGGPSLILDTLCSSALTALYHAVSALRLGAADMALAGAVHARLTPFYYQMHSRLGSLSRTGRVGAFSELADGYTPGEGVGLLLLKPLAAALRDGDPIRAVVRGVAINHNGRTAGIVKPSERRQAEVIRSALIDAGVHPDTIGHVEAHGAGTRLGDPIELAGLTAAFESLGATRRGATALGSIKPNIGHLEPAAGIAGLIKTILMLERGELLPSLYADRPSPDLDLARSPFHLSVEARPWPEADHPRRAGVSAIGLSGTNGHAVLEAAPQRPARASDPRPLVLPLAARSEASLDGWMRAHAERIDAGDDASDLAATTARARARGRHRAAIVAADAPGLARALRGDPEAGLLLRGTESAERPLVVFQYTGQASQYHGMGRRLHETSAVFREAFDEAAAGFAPHLPAPVHTLLFRDPPDPDLLSRSDVTMPVTFCVERGLSALWSAVGLRPDLVIGHSFGEIVAAIDAGIFTLADAIALVAERGRLMVAQPPTGVMAAVMAPIEALQDELARHGEALGVAGYNGPRQHVVSGRRAAVEAAVEAWEARGIQTRRLRLQNGFHSICMAGAVEPFRRAVAAVPRQAPRLRMITAADAREVGPEGPSLDYWADQIVQPVRYWPSVERLLALGARVFVEIGPGAALSRLLKNGLDEARRRELAIVWGPHASGDDLRVWAEGLARVHAAGLDLDWDAVHAGFERRRLPLPPRPLDRRPVGPEPASGLATARAAPPPPPPPPAAADDEGWFELAPPLDPEVRP